MEGNVGVNTVSTKDMTMEEYKQYIYGKILQITMNPSNMHGSISINDSISFNISEAGFETMKNDSEYEKWVLDDLQKKFNRYHLEPLPVGGVVTFTVLG